MDCNCCDYLKPCDDCCVGVVGVLGVLGNLRCRDGPPEDVGPKPLVGVALPGLWGVEEEWGEKVGVVGLDRTDDPKATVGVVARVVNICDRGFPLADTDVGVFLPVMLEDEVLSLLVRFRFPVEPYVSELLPNGELMKAGELIALARFKLTMDDVTLLRRSDESLLPDELDDA